MGAYGGRRDIMSTVAPLGPVYQAGTLSGNPLGVAAGLKTLQILIEEDPYDALEQRTAALVKGLQDASASHDIPAQLAHVGPMFGLFFTARPVANYDDAKTPHYDLPPLLVTSDASFLLLLLISDASFLLMLSTL